MSLSIWLISVILCIEITRVVMASREIAIEKLDESPYPSMLIMYKFGSGAYGEVMPVFNEIYNIAPHLKTILIYYGDCDRYVSTSCTCTLFT